MMLIMVLIENRWYRPLVLFFKARHYGPAVDMWAVGCIFGEIMLRSALFPGNSDMEIMKRIIQTLGTPRDDIWAVSVAVPGCFVCFFIALKLLDFVSVQHVDTLRPLQFEHREPVDLRPLFNTFSDEA